MSALFDLPAVAVVTPFFNAGATINDTIAAMRAQTLRQWEWVIVNDGSSDAASLAALAQLRGCGDPRVRILDQPNCGLPAARNAGVAATRAPLVFFLDSDDTIAPTALEKLAWLLHSDDRPAFATAWCEVFGSAQLLWPHGFETRDHFLFENMATPMTMIRRTAFEAAGGFDPSRTEGLEDYELWLRCASLGFWGRDIPEFLVRQRRKTPEAYTDYSWPVRDDPARLRAFHREMRALYPALYQHGLPHLSPADDRPYPAIVEEPPFENLLAPSGSHRLLYLLPQLDMGGVSSFALTLLERLRRQGYHCTVCATMPVDQPLLGEFARVADVFVLHHFLRPADSPRFLRYLVRSRQIDAVLITNSLLGYRLLPYLRAHFPDVALIDYNHMRDPSVANQGFPSFSAECHELLDAQLASSEELRGWMIAHGAPADKCQALYTATDVEHWRPDPARRAQVRAELGLGTDTPLILHAARITAQKQPQLLARVLLELARRDLSYYAIVAGDGPDLPWLREFVRRNNLGQSVRTVGAVGSERMRDLMAASDILFLPSAYEGLSLALFEAMACGVVPVTVDAGGQRELVAPDNGILVAPDEHQEKRYVAALEWLLRSPRQRTAMAIAARRRITEHFNSERLALQFDILLEQARAVAQARAIPPASTGAGAAAASAAVEELRVYIRNHRLRGIVLAWDYWKRHGARYIGMAAATRERLVRQTYPLRRAVRPLWMRLRYGK